MELCLLCLCVSVQDLVSSFEKKINTSKHYANFSKISLVNPYPFPKWIISKDIRPKRGHVNQIYVLLTTENNNKQMNEFTLFIFKVQSTQILSLDWTLKLCVSIFCLICKYMYKLILHVHFIYVVINNIYHFIWSLIRHREFQYQ